MNLQDRLLSEWRLKITLLTVATVLLLGPYMLLQRYRMFEPRSLGLTAIDEWAGFTAAWVWVYILQYIQVPLAPLLATTRDQLRKFLIGFAIVAAAAFVVFFVFPVEGPRPSAAQRETANWLYQLLIAIDRPGNALPSLHVALATYSMCFAHRLHFESTSHRRRRCWLALGWISVALISWSTLATKQHYLVDGLTGFALAVIAHHLVWRTRLFNRATICTTTSASKNPTDGGV